MVIRFFLTLTLLITFAGNCSPTGQSQIEETFTVKLLGINDFHGQVLPDQNVGGMQQLAKGLLFALDNNAGNSFILHAGDHVGGSPAESSLLQDEPSIEFLNTLNDYCKTAKDSRCAVIGIAGNHEFDEGSAEMLRLLNGGNHKKGPFVNPQWSGANYEMLSANVFLKNNGSSLLKPYSIHNVNGVSIGFIGISLDSTPQLVLPGMLDDLVFTSQIEQVKNQANALQKKGVESLVVIVHDGTEQDYYKGGTNSNNPIPLHSKFGQFVQQMPNSIDVVVTGHTHSFTNAYIKNRGGKEILVTQALSNGKAFSDITLEISKASGDVLLASANVVKVDEQSNIQLSASAKKAQNHINTIISDATDYAKRYTNVVINKFEPVVDKSANSTNNANDNRVDKSLVGQFLADAYRYELHTDLGVMNNGGVRSVLEAGEVTWGQLFAIQPFGNRLEIRDYTGLQLKQLIALNHYWSRQIKEDNKGQLTINAKSIIDTQHYSVVGNSYIMGQAIFNQGKLLEVGEQDIDASVNYLRRLPTPFNLLSEPVK